MKHTPGPWDLQDSGDALYIVGGGGTVAQIVSTQANARLIAESPNLLSVIYDLLHTTHESMIDDPAERKNYQLARMKANNVIAKAEGTT